MPSEPQPEPSSPHSDAVWFVFSDDLSPAARLLRRRYRCTQKIASHSYIIFVGFIPRCHPRGGIILPQRANFIIVAWDTIVKSRIYKSNTLTSVYSWPWGAGKDYLRPRSDLWPRLDKSLNTRHWKLFNGSVWMRSVVEVVKPLSRDLWQCHWIGKKLEIAKSHRSFSQHT